MLDLGWPELLVVALVLIIVVGPKDLPAMLRTFGRTTRKLRSMAGEFRSQFDEALKEAELDDVRSVISEAQQLNPKSILKDVVDPIAEVGNEIKSDLNKTKSDLDKTMKAATEPSPSEPGAAKPNGDAAETAKVEAKPKAEKKPAKSPAKSNANGAAKKKPAAAASRTRKTAAKPASKPAAAKRSAAKKPTASTTRKKPAASKSAKSSGDAA